MLIDNQAFNICLSIILFITSYLIGAIPFGLLIGRIFFNIDIREHGSKNIGSTNAFRILGKKGGIPVFLLDTFKGSLVIIIVNAILIPNNIFVNQIPVIFYGVAAVIGHVLPVYFDFKGGKAVATGLGMTLAISPLAGVLCLIAFAITLVISGYVSLASTIAMLTVFVTLILLYFFGVADYSNFVQFLFNKPSLETLIIFGMVGLLIIIRHRKNYARIIAGTENSFKKKNKKQA